MVGEMIIDGAMEIASEASVIWPGKSKITIKFVNRLLVTGPLNKNTVEIEPTTDSLNCALGFGVCPICRSREAW